MEYNGARGFAPYIRRTENGDQNTIVEKFIAVLNDHMCPTNQVKVVSGEEIGDNLLPEAVTHAPFVRLPVLFHVGGVRPEEVVQQSVVGNVGGAGDVSDVVHVAEGR